MTEHDDSYLEAAEAAFRDPDRPRGLPRATCALNAPPYRAPRWLIKDFWPLGLLGMIVGDGGTFKSSIALHIAGAVAGGYPVFDRYDTERRPVLIVSAEDDEDTMGMRLDAFIAGHRWDPHLVKSNVHWFSITEPVFASVAWRRHIHQEICRIGAGFIVFDPWADMLGGDENANTDARPAIKYLRELMEGGNRSVAVVHHMGKAGDNKRPLDRIRGASAVPSAARSIFFFDWHENAVHVEHLKHSRTEKLPTFVLDRTINSKRDNRMHWTAAKVVTRGAAEYRESEAKRWTLLMVAQHPDIGTRELRTKREKGDPSHDDIGAAIKSLAAEGYLHQTLGKQNKQHLKLTQSGQFRVAQFLPVGPSIGTATSDGNGQPEPDLFNQAERADRNSGTHGTLSEGVDGERAERAESVPRHASDDGPGARLSGHSLKGMRPDNSGEPPGTQETDDQRAGHEEPEEGL